MKFSDIPATSFRALATELGFQERKQNSSLTNLSMWQKALSTDSSFCQAVVAMNFLTQQQMEHATERYRLGATRQKGIIFWQINADNEIYDGKVMYYLANCHRDKSHHPTWVSTLLARRYQWPDNDSLNTRHCLFGEHLLKQYPQMPVCIVESEKSAVILSEHFPQQLWMATGGLGNVQPDKFRPLRGREVTLIPDTDTDGTTFRRWYDAAQQVMKQIFWEDSPPIRVSAILEQYASTEQRERKIDLTDLLFESPQQLSDNL